MLVITADNIPGKNIQALGVVQGNVVQSKNIGSDFMAGFKNIVGGEIEGYTQMLSEARKIAFFRMKKEAEKLDADAIIGMRYSNAAIMDGTAEIIAYGTAVRIVE